MKQWRPENWKNPFSRAAVRVEDRNGKPISHYEAFEYGADAILESLRKEQGVRITKETQMVTQPIFEKTDGYLVFIPDAEA